MKVGRFLTLVLLLSTLAFGQNSNNGLVPLQSPFHGITIVSSKLDSSTSPQTVRLDFVNDSPNNITAWAYCVYAEKAKESDPYQGVCTMIDAVGPEVERQVQEKITLTTNDAYCSTCRFVHPGEHKVLSAAFAPPVVDAQVQIKLIAYSDGTVETSGDEWGTDYFQQIVRNRKAWLTTAQQVVEMGKKILADPTNPHPTQTMINELQNRSREIGMDNTLYFFKRPEWRHANDKELIPNDERGYLNKFITERQMQAAEYSKYLIRGVR